MRVGSRSQLSLSRASGVNEIPKKTYHYLVVGAGFTGAIIAERLASQANRSVLVIDARSHIAGNAYDTRGDQQILYHRYGAHIFHTNSPKVVDYLSNFQPIGCLTNTALPR